MSWKRETEIVNYCLKHTILYCDWLGGSEPRLKSESTSMGVEVGVGAGDTDATGETAAGRKVEAQMDRRHCE